MSANQNAPCANRREYRTRIRRRAWAASVLAATSLIALAGCAKDNQNNDKTSGQAKPDSIKVINSDIAAGPNRLAFSLKDSGGQLISAPDIAMKVRLFAAGSDKPVAETDSGFVWIHEGERGLYVADIDIPEAGQWEVEATMTKPADATLRAMFKAEPKSSTPSIGATAPKSRTKTATGADLKAITTDDKPDPSLYAMTVAEAVSSGKPTVIAFSTPARCASNMCGPALDVVKEAKVAHPEANYVHVEIYDEPQNLSNDTLVPAVKEWGLPTEPWVFVVDSSGRVKAKFESVVSVSEIANALQPA